MRNPVLDNEMLQVVKLQAAATSRLADAAERIAKALESLDRNVETSTEPENFSHPGHATVFKVRRYE